MKAHAYADLFPMMSPDKLAELSADIKAKGLSDPIVTIDGQILDGRNRYEACKMAGVEPHFADYHGDDPLGYVISHNLTRRHLTEAQRAMVAAKMADLPHGGAQYSQKNESPIGRSTPTREEASKLLNVGHSSVGRAREVLKKGAKELVQAVESGQLSVNAAKDIATLPKEEQREVIKQGADAIKAKVKEIREQPQDEPEPLVVDGVKEPQKQKKLEKWVPDDARRLWLLAKNYLDQILPTDKGLNTTMKEAIGYCQSRIK